MAIEKNIMRPREFGRDRPQVEREFEERVIEVNRVSRVAKGGRRIRFRALVVIGNHKGKVGMGIGKANEVADAVRKATNKAKKKLIVVPIINGTIPHEILVKHGGSKVLFRPAAPGTSIVAGGSIRSVSELAGITDMLAKSLGSSNKVNNVIATLKAFQSFNKNVIEKLKKFDSKLIEAKEVNVEKKTETLPIEKPVTAVIPAEQVIVKKSKEDKALTPVKTKKKTNRLSKSD